MFQPYKIQWTDEKITRLWDYYSESKAAQELYFTKLVGDKVLEIADKEVGLNGLRILDYGSGPGYLFHHLKERPYKVKYCALDNSQDSINRLNSLYGSLPQFEKAFFVEKFPSGLKEKFDLIICCEVIEHLDDSNLTSMINEFKELLKPGGHVLLTTPNDEDMDASTMICPDCGCIYHRWQHQRSWSVASLSHYMAGSGFKEKKVFAKDLYERNTFHVLKHVAQRFMVKFGYKHRPLNLIYLGQVP